MMQGKKIESEPATTTLKLPWVAPSLLPLPRLTALTLQSSIPGQGSIFDGAGSTVF